MPVLVVIQYDANRIEHVHSIKGLVITLIPTSWDRFRRESRSNEYGFSKGSSTLYLGLCSLYNFSGRYFQWSA